MQATGFVEGALKDMVFSKTAKKQSVFYKSHTLKIEANKDDKKETIDRKSLKDKMKIK